MNITEPVIQLRMEYKLNIETTSNPLEAKPQVTVIPFEVIKSNLEKFKDLGVGGKLITDDATKTIQKDNRFFFVTFRRKADNSGHGAFNPDVVKLTFEEAVRIMQAATKTTPNTEEKITLVKQAKELRSSFDKNHVMQELCNLVQTYQYKPEFQKKLNGVFNTTLGAITNLGKFPELPKSEAEMSELEKYWFHRSKGGSSTVPPSFFERTPVIPLVRPAEDKTKTPSAKKATAAKTVKLVTVKEPPKPKIVVYSEKVKNLMKKCKGSAEENIKGLQKKMIEELGKSCPPNEGIKEKADAVEKLEERTAKSKSEKMKGLTQILLNAMAKCRLSSTVEKDEKEWETGITTESAPPNPPPLPSGDKPRLQRTMSETLPKKKNESIHPVMPTLERSKSEQFNSELLKKLRSMRAQLEDLQSE